MRGLPGSVICALTLDVANPFFAEVTRGMQDRLAEAGCVLMTCSSDLTPAKAARHLRELEEHPVRGVLVTPVNAALEEFVRLAERGTPVVLIDHPRDGEDLCAVTVDNVMGGRLATEHLLELGHRRLGFVSSAHDMRNVNDRRVGIVSALCAAGLDDKNALMEWKIGSPRLAAEVTRIVQSIVSLPAPPTGIICFNDTVASALLRGFSHAGVTVPETMSVIGYNDLEFAPHLSPPLTTVRQPNYQLGRMGVSLLLNEAVLGHRHEEVVFLPTLVVRDSTAPARESLSAGSGQKGSR